MSLILVRLSGVRCDAIANEQLPTHDGAAAVLKIF